MKGVFERGLEYGLGEKNTWQCFLGKWNSTCLSVRTHLVVISVNPTQSQRRGDLLPCVVEKFSGSQLQARFSGSNNVTKIQSLSFSYHLLALFSSLVFGHHLCWWTGGGLTFRIEIQQSPCFYSDWTDLGHMPILEWVIMTRMMESAG